MLHAGDIAIEQMDQRDLMRSTFKDHWDGFTFGAIGYKQAVPIDPRWASTVDNFLASGLRIHDLLDGIDIAMASRCRADATWRYFCGVMWRKLTERQEVARQILAAEGDA
jgi:hypothetical protein